MGNLGGGLKTIDWDNTRLEKFEKNFYREDPHVSARSDREIDDFRAKHEMKVSHRYDSLSINSLIIASTD